MLTGFCSVMCGVSKVVSVDLMCDHVFFQGKGRWVSGTRIKMWFLVIRYLGSTTDVMHAF